MRGFGLIGLALAVCVLACPVAFAARLHDVPVRLNQPDGTEVRCLLSGDEYYRWAHDAQGHLLTRDEGGWIVYARTGARGIEPTGWVAGTVDPVQAGLAPVTPAPAAHDLERWRLRERLVKSAPPPRMPNTGQLNNIVVFIRFSNQTEFPDAAATWDALFNAQDSGANSMSRYYQEVSRQQLDIRTSLFPVSTGTVVSFLDSHPRGYYQKWSPSNQDGYLTEEAGGQRLHDLLRRAVEAIADQVPADLDVDVNDDGYVDNVCYVTRGTADNWADWLWPHMWNLQFGNVAFINGKQVSTYNFQLADVVQLPHVGNGVLCHEMFHSLGAPDLYRYETGSGTFFPVGKWDLMEDNENPPQHMLTFMKMRYGGWVGAIPKITASGLYTLNPVTAASGTCYRIDSPNSTSEYFVVEYRRSSTSMFEASLPGSGLIVYRINSAADGNGNAQGPPDEVYVYRPNGTLSVNGDPASAHFSSGSGRTAINDQTNPSSFLSNGQAGGLSISEIGGAGESITFRVTIDGSPPPPACATTMGDAQGDGQVNLFDLIAVVNDILVITPLGEGARACADMDQSGTINVLDLVAIVNLILQGGPQPEPEPLEARGVGAPPPVPVRVERGPDGSVRIRLRAADAARVAALQAEWPALEMAGGPRVEGASAAVAWAWRAGGGRVRALLYSPELDAVADGDLVLVLGRPDGRRDRFEPASIRLVLSDRHGRALPIELDGGPFGPDAPPQPDVPTGTEGESRSGAGLEVWPNPTTGAIRIQCSGLAGRTVRISVVDAAGRAVRTLDPARVGDDGAAHASWDGRDAGGVPVASGVYFVRAGEAIERGGPAARVLVLR